MACAMCGAPIGAEDTYCPRCGARQPETGSVSVDAVRAALERAVGSQYEILRLLGRGGMGSVYLARERALERSVAIKVLPPEVAGDAESRERFLREARTAANLTHPDIVPLHSFGEAEGMPYFVMGYVRGESLAERLRRDGRVEAEEVRRILSEVAGALDYAHRQGVVHRDIKPDNILLEDETGRSMLADFGVAKGRAVGGTLTETGAVVGTPHYMSPEQAWGGRELDGRSDLYSLGVTGYVMLSGRLPFEGGSLQVVLAQHAAREPTPLEALVPEAPRDLVDAVMRCLAKEPERRWESGRALREALSEGAYLEADEDAPEAPMRSGLLQILLSSVGIAAYGMGAFLFPALRIGEGVPWWFFPALFAVVLPSTNALLALWARLRGAAWRAILRQWLLPSRKWPYWWPERWRWPGDVWNRLPPLLRTARVLRGWLTPLFVVGTAVIVASVAKGADDGVVHGIVLITTVLAIAGWVGISLAEVRWGLARGLGEGAAGRLVALSTADPLWHKPKYAALLLPPPGRTPAPPRTEPRSPVELARAIQDIVAQLPSETRTTVSEATGAARQLADLVAALDVELGKLAQDVDPQELAAVEAKLQALGPEREEEGEVRRQKRTLLAEQRDLLRRLDQRLAAATDRRTRLMELLRTMWLQMANLRAEAARDNLEATEVSARVRALCTEIEAQVLVAEQLREIT